MALGRVDMGGCTALRWAQAGGMECAFGFRTGLDHLEVHR